MASADLKPNSTSSSILLAAPTQGYVAGLVNRLTQQHNVTKTGCKKCGYPGHLTFECMNFISTEPIENNTNIAVLNDDTVHSSDAECDDSALRKKKRKRKKKKDSKKKKKKDEDDQCEKKSKKKKIKIETDELPSSPIMAESTDTCKQKSETRDFNRKYKKHRHNTASSD